MNLSRWDIKRLIRALDLAEELASYRSSLKDWPAPERGRHKRDAAFFKTYRHDLELVLQKWVKNKRIEL